MSEVLLYAPQLGEGITSLKVVNIHKEVGENVSSDEVLLSVETDKAVVDIESPSDGLVKSIFCNIGDIIDIGKLLIKIESKPTNEDFESYKNQYPIERAEPSFPVLISDRDNSNLVGISPRIIGYCRRKNIPIHDLKKIEGTGEGGRIRLQDVISFVNKLPLLNKVNVNTAALSPAWLKNDIEIKEEDVSYKIFQISNSQKQLNYAMAKSYIVPQASVSITARIPEKPLSLAVAAIAKISNKFEKLRAEYIDENTIKIHDKCSVGCAVAMPGDDIKTIVYESCSITEKEDIIEYIVSEVNKARRQKQNQNITRRHSVSISDMSGFGIEDASPFVVSPSVATLFIGSRLDSGHSKLTLAFDHRVMNGAYAARVLKAMINNI